MLYFARWKIALIAVTLLAGILWAAPNFLNAQQRASLPDFMPHKQVNLGLDLQGGSHLLLEVEVEAVVSERLESLRGDVRPLLFGAENRIRHQAGIVGDLVSIRLANASDMETAVAALRPLARQFSGGIFSGGATAPDVLIEEVGTDTITLQFSENAREQMIRSAVGQSIEIVRRRVDEFGTNEPTIQRQGSDRILVQLPGIDDPERIKDILGKTAKLAFRMVDHTVSPADLKAGRVRSTVDILPDDANPNVPYAVKKQILVAGENLVDAQPGFDQNGRPAVLFRFDSAGAQRFARATKANVGRPFAIVLDNKVISAPVIQEPILGGSGQITGNFTVEGANDLALVLRAGALPAPLTILEERSVGPELGADSVAAGEIAFIIAFLAVIVYMALSYGPVGLFANVALIGNLFLILGVLSLFQATLTLPGIAGIVLTIGMAVDANVLIFERIREELKAGKTALNAIETGYSRALGTILDANITTFIAAGILFAIGSGPVKGFSVTLAIGVVTSVFTAFTVTRLFVSIWAKRRRSSTLVI